MRTPLAPILTALFLVAALSPTHAADEKKLTPQQERMKECNTQAG